MAGATVLPHWLMDEPDSQFPALALSVHGSGRGPQRWASIEVMSLAVAGPVDRENRVSSGL